MNTIKKSLIKTARMPTTDVCTYKLMKNDLPSLWTPIKLYNILGGKTAQIN